MKVKQLFFKKGEVGLYRWLLSNDSDLLKAKGKSSQRRYGKKMRKLAAEHAPFLTNTPPQHVNSQVLPFLQHSVRQGYTKGCIFFIIRRTWPSENISY